MNSLFYESLRERGYFIAPSVLAPDVLARARDAIASLTARGSLGRNFFEGHKTRRVYALLAKTRAIDPLVLHPEVLAVVDRYLDSPLLSAALAVEIGGGEVHQPWHADGEFYGVPFPRAPIGVSTMWALEDFTAENGATEISAGSHVGPLVRPAEGVRGEPCVMPAGSVCVFFDNVLHRGGANVTSRSRLGLTIQYCQGWARTIENMCLAVPPEIVAGLPDRLQELIGYSIHPPFVGYVDGRHPKKLLAGLPRGDR